MSRLSGLLALLALGLAAPGKAEPPTLAEGRVFARALEEARVSDWADAEALARSIGPAGADALLWLRLRKGGADWSDYRDFLARDPAWPDQDRLRAAAERVMPDTLPPARVIDFFGSTPPLTGTGALRLADALRASGRDTQAADVITKAWTDLSLSPEEQGAIQLDWNATVAAHNAARLDRLLWRGLTAEAENMLPLVDADWQALGRARIGVRRDADGINALIEALPGKLRDDPGLTYERYLYRLKRGRFDEAMQLMLASSTSAGTLGQPDFWMDRRAALAREALADGDPRKAYALAAGGHGTAGSDYADCEWMAGYIALTRLDDPKTAITHFERFQSLVFTPISLGRAGYWLGRARAAAGDRSGASAAFRAAAAWQTSFYGQLAAERIGVGFDPDLAHDHPAPDWRGDPATQAPLVQAGLLFALAGDDRWAGVFLRAAAAGQPAATRAAIAQMAIDIGLPHMGIRVAKDAATDRLVLPGQYYPLNAIARAPWPVPTELALAIARQESEMNPAAISDAGARGLMQLMPDTARHVAGIEGLPYQGADLTGDPLYNARLGTAYLAQLLSEFDGSYVLTAAAYNAGPNRVRQWIAQFGDPRAGTDPVAWIESIPYEETRNYVMRVLEGMQIYRLRLEGNPAALQLATDIRATG